jgi:Putative mono-oxygenase ydhR
VHTIVITFDLVDMTHERYAEVCAELAPAVAAVPGLLAKIWLTDPDDARYGGVYLFAATAAGDGFLGSALARSVATNPHFAGLVVQRYGVDEVTTARTQPGITVVGSAIVAV